LPQTLLRPSLITITRRKFEQLYSDSKSKGIQARTLKIRSSTTKFSGRELFA
jgi:hypothetical protein